MGWRITPTYQTRQAAPTVRQNRFKRSATLTRSFGKSQTPKCRGLRQPACSSCGVPVYPTLAEIGGKLNAAWSFRSKHQLSYRRWRHHNFSCHLVLKSSGRWRGRIAWISPAIERKACLVPRLNTSSLYPNTYIMPAMRLGSQHANGEPSNCSFCNEFVRGPLGRQHQHPAAPAATPCSAGDIDNNISGAIFTKIN